MESSHTYHTYTFLQLKDKIDELLLKAQSITSCLLIMHYTETRLCPQYWQGALWAIDSYLDELEHCMRKLEINDEKK